MTVVYVHGIGQTEPAATLKRQYNDAFLGGDSDEETKLAYWADILHPLAQRMLQSPPRGFQDFVDTELPESPIGELVSPRDETQRFARSLYEKMSHYAVGDEDVRKIVERGSRVQALPTEWLRRRVTEWITRRFIQEVAAYFYDPVVHEDIQQRLLTIFNLGDGPFVLVTHSLGTVITYDVLHRIGEGIEVPIWVTLGSPLGIGEVQDHITKPLVVPKSVGHWFNFADMLDPVAMDKWLANDFQPGEKISDKVVVNGDAPRRPHSALGYLAHPDVRSVLGYR